jgi:hypothetical protein
MVSESLDGAVSPIGDGLSLLIAVMFSIATVITRRFAHVRMTPATCLGTMLAAAFAASQATQFAVSGHDMAFLFAFGVINLGLGLAFFATGARLVPAAIAALLGTFEPILGPIWVWASMARCLPCAPSSVARWWLPRCLSILGSNSSARLDRRGRASPACHPPIDATYTLLTGLPRAGH